MPKSKSVKGSYATLADAFNYYLTKIKLSKSTKNNFGYTRDKIDKAGLLEGKIQSFTPAKFREFLAGLSDLSEASTFQVYIQVKTVLNRYIHDHNLDIKIHLDRLMRQPKPKQVKEGEENYLTFQEVKDLMDIDLSNNPKANYARDLFCLMCFTGMAVSDMGKFTPDKCVSMDGKWMSYYRKKNGQKCEIPLLPVTHLIIERNKWPAKISDRVMQKRCDDLSKLVGKKVTPHTARRTWGGIALEFGFSMETVAHFLGHSTIRITEKIYAKVSRQKIERELKEIPQSMRDLMKVD